MKRLNLIPRDLRFGPIYRLFNLAVVYQAKVITAALVSLVSLAFLVSIVQSVSTRILTGKIEQEKRLLDTITAKSESLKILFKQYSDTEAYLASIMEFARFKAAYLSAIKDRPTSWAATLSELRKTIPKRVWLYGLSTEKGLLKIEGGSFDETLVGVFMSNLRSSVCFSDVNFNYTKRTKIGGTEVVNFELVCRYNLGAALQ